MDPPPLRSASMAQPKAEVAEVAGILDLGHFSIAVQLIYRPMMTEHHNTGIGARMSHRKWREIKQQLT